MPEESPTKGPTRRDFLLTGLTGLATATTVSSASASDEAIELIERLTGKAEPRNRIAFALLCRQHFQTATPYRLCLRSTAR